MRKKITIIAGSVFIGAALGGIAQGQRSADSKKIVRAEQFELIDKNGRERLFINLNRNGDPTIALLDKEGNVRASLGMNKDAGPVLILEDQGQVVFLDGKRARRLFLYVNKKGDPRMEVIDQEDKSVWTAP